MAGLLWSLHGWFCGDEPVSSGETCEGGLVRWH